MSNDTRNAPPTDPTEVLGGGVAGAASAPASAVSRRPRKRRSLREEAYDYAFLKVVRTLTSSPWTTHEDREWFAGFLKDWSDR